MLLIDNVASNHWVDRSSKVLAGQADSGILTLQAVHAAAAGALNQVSNEEDVLKAP